jgi:polyferredoxin
MRKSIFTSLILSLSMLFLLSNFIIARYPSPPILWTAIIWTFFLTFITFSILKFGKVSKYRSLFFIIYSFSFILIFISNLLEERGGMAITKEVIEKRDVPICPVAIPQLLLPVFLKKTLIFPAKILGGPYGGFLPIFLLWLVSVIALGKGWCSWGCFFGGIDEGFSKILKKKKINSEKIGNRLRYLSFSVLFVSSIFALILMEPFYCSWLCPLKLVTEYVEMNNIKSYIQGFIFLTLGILLLFLLPLLMKKRAHCGLFCPLGALQSILGNINPYRVRIDKSKCLECGKCKRICPTFSITDENIREGKISITCTRCGLCMDSCPNDAINYHLLGVNFSLKDLRIFKRTKDKNLSLSKKILLSPLRFFEEIFDARTLFIFTSILFGGTMSGSFVPQAIWKLWLFVKNFWIMIK